jgi:DNA mismatch repair protein MSH3
MAQCGSFVPARAATLTALDGVYTRMGAADCLATGASTFLEEMSECAAILRRAGRRSLVVLDELGRGTSTHDGVAVAHATLEHLVKREVAPGDDDTSAAGKGLTLFVTHYPQVAREMRAKYPDACRAAFTSYHAVRVREEDETETGGVGAAERAPERVEFLYKLTPGVAHRSFGLNVARMAGLPASVLRAAGAKASALERADAAKRARKEASERRRRRGAEEEAGDDEAFARSLDVVGRATRGALDAVAEAAARFREDPGGGGAIEALAKRRAEIEREATTTA